MFFKCNVIKLKCKRKCEVAQSRPTLRDPMECSPPGFSVRGDSPGQKTGVGCHALLQRIFLTQGSNPHSPALAGEFFTTSATWEARVCVCVCILISFNVICGWNVFQFFFFFNLMVFSDDLTF